MAQENSISQELADLLVTNNFDPEYRDEGGKSTGPGDANTISFDYRSTSGANYGSAVAVIGDDNELMLFFGDNLGRSMQDQDKDEWFGFLNQMRKLAQSHRYSFSPQNLSRLKHSLAGQAAVKEGLFEGYYGSRRESFIGEPTDARILIKHNKIIGEDDKRYRYIESIFIETADGERFKLQSNRLIHGRAMLEHVRSGGRPYDVRGNHINEMVQELSVLSRFNRAKQHHVYEGITQELVESAAHYYRSLQENLKRLSSSRGYHTYFESWAPDQIDQQESLVEDLKNMFVQQTLDTRIEAALPTLAKIQQQGTKMKEAEIFENYMNRLSAGTWALPDTPEAYEKLQQLMSAKLIVGADAMNATEQLYDVVGDAKLFEILENLADNDPRANIWDDSKVQERLAELGVQTPQSTQAAPAAVPQDTAPPVAEGFGDKNTSEFRNNFINWITLNEVDVYEDELLGYFDKFVDGGGSEYKAGEQAANTWKARMKRDGESVRKPEDVAEGDYPNDPFREIHSQGQQAGIAGKPNNNPYGEPGDSKEASYWDDGYELGLQIRRKRTGVAEVDVPTTPEPRDMSDFWKQARRNHYGAKRPVGEDAELARMLQHAGVPLQEGVLNDDTRNTWDHLLDRFRHEVEQFKKSGKLDDDLYDAVFDYYDQHGAMPYRVRNAKDGTVNQWISNRLSDDLGINENLISPMIMPVSEGSCNMTMEGEYCPEHGLMECGSMYEDGGAVGMPYSMGEDAFPTVNISGLGYDDANLAGEKFVNPIQPRKHNALSPLTPGDSRSHPPVAHVDLTSSPDTMEEGVYDPDYRGGYNNEFDELEDLLSRSGMSQDDLMRQRFLASKHGLNTPADMSKLPALKKDAETGYVARKAALDADLEKRNQQYLQDKLTDLEYQQDPVAFVKRRTQQLSPTLPMGPKEPTAPTAPDAPADVAATPGTDYSLPRAKLGSSPSAKFPNFRPEPAAEVPAPADQTDTRNQKPSIFQQLAQLRNRTRGTMAETSTDDPINSNSAMTGAYYEGKETPTQEGDALLARIKSLALLR